jgi:hypothetical protein
MVDEMPTLSWCRAQFEDRVSLAGSRSTGRLYGA